MMKMLGGRRIVLVVALGLPAGLLFAAEVDLKPVQKRLASDTKQDRVTGVRELMRLKPSPAAARPLLEDLVNDPEPEVRAESVGAIQEILGDKGTDLLEKLYNDDSTVVRDGTIRAACRKSANAIAGLVTGFENTPALLDSNSARAGRPGSVLRKEVSAASTHPRSSRPWVKASRRPSLAASSAHTW